MVITILNWPCIKNTHRKLLISLPNLNIELIRQIIMMIIWSLKKSDHHISITWQQKQHKTERRSWQAILVRTRKIQFIIIVIMYLKWLPFWQGEYTDCISCRGVSSPPPDKYVTKLHPMMRLEFWRTILVLWRSMPLRGREKRPNDWPEPFAPK